VDWSHPGEPPKYDKPGVSADEGASDVPSDESGTATGGSTQTQARQQDSARQ
jgi:hypothetical protein